MGPIERTIKEGLGKLEPSPSVMPEPGFKVPAGAEEREESCLVTELVQSQLALWTLSLSSLFTWLWTSRKHCLLFNLCFLLPASLLLTAALSGALVVFVSLGRVLFPATSSGVPSWVVRRLPEPSCPSLLRRRRSFTSQQHSLRNRRFRALASEGPAVPAPLHQSPSNPKLHALAPQQPSYFWQRSHSPPAQLPVHHRLSASHFRS